MTVLLAIDGSIRCVGAALFRDGRLQWTGYVRWGKRSTKTNPGERAQILADECAQMLPSDLYPTAVAYEWPQAYGDDKNPNDLFGILAVSGHIVGAFNARAKSYLPREWTGGIPKATKGDPHTSPRAAKISARLDPAELSVFGDAKTHDEIDAVGIGLHHLGRSITTRRRVIDRE